MPHHFFVTEEIRAARIQYLALSLGQFGNADQIGQQIIQRNRRRAGLHPFRRDHDRQVINQVANHFVGSRTGADNDGGANFDHRHRAGPQALAGIAPREQMLGTGAFRNDAAEIDDTLDAGHSRRNGKIAGCFNIQLAEMPATGHRMHQVISDADPGQSFAQRFRLECIGFDNLDALPAPGFKRRAAPGDGTY